MSHVRLFLKFLTFGFLAWGGPVAQIGMLRKELVEKEGWVTPEKFNRVLAVYQALPGPEAHELCVYMGMVKAGRIGAVLAGLGFMLPGVLLMILLAWGYQTAGPAALLPLFAGVKPAVSALIFRALHRIARHALTGQGAIVCSLAAIALTLLQAHFAIVLLVCGAAQALWVKQKKRAAATLLAAALLSSAVYNQFMTEKVEAPPAGAKDGSALFAEGLKGGLLSFGGAYTAIPFLQDSMVNKAPNVTQEIFLDSIAFASMIPAPLISFATFLGYIAGGLSGAFLITIGIFLPAFLFTILGHRHLERAVEYEPFHSFLDGVTAGVTGILALTALDIFRQSVSDMAAGVIFVCALASLYVFKSKWAAPAAIICSGAVWHLIMRLAGG